MIKFIRIFKNLTIGATTIGGISGAYIGLNDSRIHNILHSSDIYSSSINNFCGLFFTGIQGSLIGLTWMVSLPLFSISLMDQKKYIK